MAQASKKKSPAEPLSATLVRNVKEISTITLGAVSIFLAIALLSYHPDDPGWSQAVTVDRIHNKAGFIGAWIADILLYLFGYLGYLFPLIMVFDGWRIFQTRANAIPVDYFRLGIRILGFLMLLAGGCGLCWLHFAAGGHLPYGINGAGGIFGNAVGSVMKLLAGPLGGTLVLLTMLLVGITIYSSLSWLWLMDAIGRQALALMERLQVWSQRYKDNSEGRKARRERETVVQKDKEKQLHRPPLRIEPVISGFEPSARAQEEKQELLFAAPADSVLPPLNLLDPAPPPKGQYSRESLEAMSRQVELKLKDFGVEVSVVAVHPGPVITRFELQPAPGVKGNQIANLSKDLARSLSVISVRVVDVIPGKSVIGLEIPNENRELVTLGEIINTREYENAPSRLILALGKDISGQVVLTDLGRMPHLLVAGTTGSGKSVALNAMIISILYKATAREVRMIMIDPKMLELSVYEGIPHLLAPVVTDMKEAANALRWCVAEMERRYKLMAPMGVRNISGFNKKVRDAAKHKQPLRDPLFVPMTEGAVAPELEALPFIVVVVDELADMMMTVGKKVEELIARLAQKARASGIHLILATQRPSVDVITGLIKANIPSRIAFQVSSKVDSRTILDQMGAESLLGHGDMLFLSPGTGIPERVHGAFVDDNEVHRVVQHIKGQGEPDYQHEIIRGPGEGGADPIPGIERSGNELDPLYDEAVAIVTESRKASISYIQRRLKIGYNRAARMVEEMEASGLVGPLETNGNREVLAAAPPPAD
ncbi:MAG: cell division protein FtsK [Gammaproteobacteria bacterium RIFCSPLOWO2_02_FULL_56_15]|nr:MAG: cell division protein FtsK [Gammaproteobacteria bacterium RIFCSPLOWO2_02_FULL_56_15]